MKQTAVEWLEKEFIKLESTTGVHGVMYELLDKAMKLEKEQMIDLIKFIRTQDKMGKSANDLYEQYYNEKYEE